MKLQTTEDRMCELEDLATDFAQYERMPGWVCGPVIQTLLECLGLSPGFVLYSSSLLTHSLGSKSSGWSTWVPATHMGDLHWVPYSLLSLSRSPSLSFSNKLLKSFFLNSTINTQTQNNFLSVQIPHRKERGTSNKDTDCQCS